MPKAHPINTIKKKAIRAFYNIKKLKLTPTHWKRIVDYFNTHPTLKPSRATLLAIIEEKIPEIPNVYEQLRKKNPARAARKLTSLYHLSAIRKAEREKLLRSPPDTRCCTPTLVAHGTPQGPITPRMQLLINNRVQIIPLVDVNTPTKHPVPLKQRFKDDDKSKRLYLLTEIGAPDQPDNPRAIYAPYYPPRLLPTERSLEDVQAQLPRLHYQPIKPVSAEVSAKSILKAQRKPRRGSLKTLTGASSHDIFAAEEKLELLDDSLHPANWGHAVPHVLNGPDLPHNLMPQTAPSNQGMTWPLIEEPLRRQLLSNPRSASFYKVSPQYDPDKPSLIPTNIHTEVTLRRDVDDSNSSITTHKFNVNPRSNQTLTRSDIKVIHQLWELDAESVSPRPL